MYLDYSNLGETYRNALVRFRYRVSELNAHRYNFSKKLNAMNCQLCEFPRDN